MYGYMVNILSDYIIYIKFFKLLYINTQFKSKEVKNTMDKNNKMLSLLVVIVCYGVSAWLTVRLLTEGCIDIMEWAVMIATAIVFEGSKLKCASWAIDSRHKDGFRLSMAVLFVILFCVSAMSSQAFLQNSMKNKQTQKIITSSDYQDQVKKQKNNQDQLNAIDKEIEDLRKQRDSKPANWYTVKKGYDDKIIAKQKEREKYTTNLNTSLSIDQTKILADTMGYRQTLAYIAKKLNKDYSEVELFFFSAIGLLLEILGIAWYVKHSGSAEKSEKDIEWPEHLENKTDKPKKKGILNRILGGNKKTAEPTAGKPSGPVAKLKNPIGFKHDPEPDPSPTLPNFTQDDILKYVEYGWNNIKIVNGEETLLGYKTISKRIGFETTTTADKIKSHLETIGATKTDGGKTYVVLQKNEVLKKI